MKKLINLSLSLLTMAFAATSCTNSPDEDINAPDKGKEAVMTVKFNNPTSRAVGTATDESVITSGTIMVFRAGSGVLDGLASFTSIAAPINVKITAGTRDVYVVANTGIDYSGVQNVADLNNFATKYSMSSIHSDGSNLPMSGVALAQNASAATLANPTPVTVTMQYMVSKVKIAWDLTQLNPSMNQFTVTGAYLLNVKAATNSFAFGTDNLTTNVLAYEYGRSSITGFTGAYLPGATYTNARNANLDLTSPATNSGNNYFYIAENNVTASPTIVTIEATVLDAVSSTTTTYYYPIVINGTQNTSSGDGTSTVVRGKYYTVTATIKGFGNDDPYNPITNAAMDVTIVSPSWTPVAINETFN